VTGADVAVAFRAARDLFLPRVCGICREPVPAGVAGRLCTGCILHLEDLAFAPGDVCPRCALPRTGRRCRRCPKGALIAATASFGPFEGTLREAVHVFKFEGDPGLGAPLGKLAARAARTLPADVDVVVPVPLHFSRLLGRGFNQSAVLARHVAGELGKPLVLDALSRARASAEQSGSSRTDRRANVRGAFVAKRARVAGKRVLLVDDVLTTGATAHACALALQNAGAQPVYVVALARAHEQERESV